MAETEKYELPAEIKELHDAIDANMSHARFIERRLQAISGAASILGLDSLAKQLMILSEGAVPMAQRVRDAQSADTVRQMREQEERSNLMMSASLALALADPEVRDPVLEKIKTHHVVGRTVWQAYSNSQILDNRIEDVRRLEYCGNRLTSSTLVSKF